MVKTFPKYYPATGSEENNEKRPYRGSKWTPSKYKFRELSLHQPEYTFTVNEVIPGGLICEDRDMYGHELASNYFQNQENGSNEFT
jgi:hypothetical protein